MPVGKNLPFPLKPIWDPRKKAGGVETGITPPGTLPPTLTLVGSLADTTNLVNPEDVAIVGSTAWVGSVGNDYLTSIDISNLASPAFVNKWQALETDSMARLAPFTASQLLGTSYNTDQLHVYDVTIPASPSEVGQVTSTPNMNGPIGVAAGAGFCVVVSDQGNELAYVDLSVPATPTVTGNVTDGTNLNGAADVALVTIASTLYAVVAAYANNRVTVVDLSTPATPTVVGSVTDGTNLWGTENIAIYGEYAVATSVPGDRVTVVDLSTPASPTVVGSVTDAADLNGASGIVVSGDYALVACGVGNRISVVSLVDPANPAVVQTITDATQLAGVKKLDINGSTVAAIAQGTRRLTTLTFA